MLVFLVFFTRLNPSKRFRLGGFGTPIKFDFVIASPLAIEQHTSTEINMRCGLSSLWEREREREKKGMSV